MSIMLKSNQQNHRRVEIAIAESMGLTRHRYALWGVGMHNPLGLGDVRMDGAVNNETCGIHSVVGFTHRIPVDVYLH